MLPCQNKDAHRTARQVQSCDRVAIAGSLLCAIHCSIQSILFVSIPIIGLGLASELFEIGSMAVTLLVSSYALFSGYKFHRRLLPVIPALIAVTALIASMSMHGDHNDTRGSLAIWIYYLLLIVAHVTNLQLTRTRLRREPPKV